MGRDYLTATALVLLISGIAGPPMPAALGFSLAALAAISLSLMRLSSSGVRISVEPRKLRVFKSESAVALVRLDPGGRRWMRTGALSLSNVPGIESECRVLDRASFELALKPVLAGRFRLLDNRLELADVLGLFSWQQTVPIDMVVESLPLALLAPRRSESISLLAVGENPAGRVGSGQELYAVGQYLPNTDAKDILWRRVARMEDGSMPVKLREANIRMSVQIYLALGWNAAEQHAERIDLAMEAVAQIGTLLLSVGTTLEITFALGSSLETKRATNEVELVGTLMALSETTPTERLMSGLAAYNLLILGPDQVRELETSVTPRPTLVVSEKSDIPVLPPGASAFTGREDLSALSMQVLNQ